MMLEISGSKNDRIVIKIPIQLGYALVLDICNLRFKCFTKLSPSLSSSWAELSLIITVKPARYPIKLK